MVPCYEVPLTLFQVEFLYKSKLQIVFLFRLRLSVCDDSLLLLLSELQMD